MDDLVRSRKPAVRPNQLEFYLAKAKDENYSNLYLNHENLEEIPRNVFEISSIQGLFLKRNLLKSLSPDLCRLPLLKTLYLPSNQLNSLPEEIGNCVNLEDLNVDNNYLVSFPKTISGLKKLKKLQASSNELKTIPSEIGELTLLEVLELMNNSIQFLPKELSKCTNLRSLFVDGNMIKELPSILLGLGKLQYLSLSRNCISHLPQDINKLRMLKSLVLDNNELLAIIPATVFRIAYLETIGLHGCGSSNGSRPVSEILEEYIRLHGLKEMIGNIETLLELCLRSAPDTNQRQLLPKPLQTLLNTPRGYCKLCKQKYYVNAFFELSDNNQVQVTTEIKNNIRTQIKNTNCYFIFCYCSYNCSTIFSG